MERDSTPPIPELEKLSHKIKSKDIKTLVEIDKFFRENGWMPTYRELFKPLGVNSTSVVKNRLDRLLTFGLIKREPKKSKMALTEFGKFAVVMIQNKELLNIFTQESPLDPQP